MNGISFDTMQECGNGNCFLLPCVHELVYVTAVLKLVIILVAVVIGFMELDFVSFCCIRSIIGISPVCWVCGIFME